MRGLFAAWIGLGTAFSAAPALGLDELNAAAAAGELREMCREDAGQLWAIDLCGPLMVVEPETRRVWTTKEDSFGVLEQAGAGWSGTLPAGVPVANTTIEWAGERWIQVLAPLPEEAEDRRVLLAHEAWHRAQQALGLGALPSDCAHLENERARTLMRLEFRALGVALRSSGRGRRQAAQEALMMRAARHAEFPGAAAQEAALDRNEGLAAYTGVRLGVTDNPDLYAARVLHRYELHRALARSYAYASGPAYGLLLDVYRPDWRRELGDAAPADLLAAALLLRPWSQAELYRAGERYGASAIAAEDRARAEARQARFAELRLQYGGGPRVELPLQDVQMEFDPNGVTPLEGLGTLYSTLTIRAAWGELRAENGALISTDGRRVIVPLPGPGGLSGPGWQVSLAPRYVLVGPDVAGVFRPTEIPSEIPPEDAPAENTPPT